MAVTDPIADLLTRIRNASKARHDLVELPSSNLLVNVVKILKDQGYIKNFRVVDDSRQGVLKVYLRYDANGIPVVGGIKRISRPGLRRYYRADGIPKVLNGMGISILSTSKGLLTDVEARKENVGGEILCEVW